MLAKSNVAVRQVTPKAQRTKELIYLAALKLFSEKGFEQTTMREIAKKADVAIGGAYYYFQSKEEIVMHFYEHNQSALTENARQIFAEIPQLEGRLKALFKMQFEYFSAQRSIFGVLARITGDPNHPLSPFSKETVVIREHAITIFKEAIDGPKIKVADDLKQHLPYLLWLYHMGLIYFWIHDSSKDQMRTQKLMEGSLAIIIRLIKLSHFPFISSVKKLALDLLNEVHAEEEAP